MPLLLNLPSFFFAKLLLRSSNASPFASYCAGCQIVLPRENEPVLLGAAVLGAVAGKKFPGVRDAMKALNAAGKVFPNVSSAVLTYIILNLDLPSLLLVVTRIYVFAGCKSVIRS